ncbi:restriction endonuclease subunit S [Prevotella copri]|uniref:restriction endonuclease subunit S n=1 Tax=Segatella copri TaxID=165179 RepID=UPI0020CD2142|nr:restriction endonuclease subunit S [Segatella copri]MCP9539188.1 restriction endonuclease subunit S [Segatella copri]
MDTKALRQKILDLAIHGKLVPQDPNDEPASVLLERIRAEKERLIKEGKIKKGKKSAKTSDKPHYPFELPKGWAITDIGELLINRDGERKPVSSAIRCKQKDKVYDYYGAAGVIDKVDEYLFDERLLLIGEDGANLLSKSKDNAFFADGKYWVNNHAHVLDATDKSILDFVAIVINCMKLDDFITGSAQPKLSQDNLNKIPVMLPPINEQCRILKKVKHWFSLIAMIERCKDNFLETIKQTKFKILDLAIHGKLVPQDPNDEPASELLKRINPKAEITCDNPQYGKLPKGWCLCKISSVVDIVNGKSQKNVESPTGKYPIYGSGGIIGKAMEYTCLAGSTIIGRKGTINHPIFVEENFWNVDTAFGMKANNQILEDKYFYCFCLYFDFSKLDKSSALPSLTKTAIGNLILPIPPLAEQQRIVAKIEELFAQLDKIESSLQA